MPYKTTVMSLRAWFIKTFISSHLITTFVQKKFKQEDIECGWEFVFSIKVKQKNFSYSNLYTIFFKVISLHKVTNNDILALTQKKCFWETKMFHIKLSKLLLTLKNNKLEFIKSLLGSND